MDDDEWKEMDAKATSAIHLNLSDEVIHNVVIFVLKKLELGTQPLVPIRHPVHLVLPLGGWPVAM